MTLNLFNSLTRQVALFDHPLPYTAKVYTCGPTVYNYQHIGNMRAYIFADTLCRALLFKGYDLKHVINITDVGHLTSDADAGDDKMERAAAQQGKTAWDIAKFYEEDFKRDLARLNVLPFDQAGAQTEDERHPRATDYVPQMIDWAKSIADKHCYVLEGGLYFDTSTVPNYGALARAKTDEGQSRIDPVPGKRNPQDFAIWRTTPLGETRQMEWESPWGRGAPGWHLECSVMSGAILGFPFDIHTGGIDHREIHHPCEIAQNQAHEGCADSGARIWMHNNFLIDRTKTKNSGKMSKSSGEFLRLQTLIDKGFHPLAYRMMCLQAHYRSEMEFTWEGLSAAFVRLKRLVTEVSHWRLQSGGLFSEHDQSVDYRQSFLTRFDETIVSDLNTATSLTFLEEVTSAKTSSQTLAHDDRNFLISKFDDVLGLNLKSLTRADLRIRPTSAMLTEADIEARLEERKTARAAKDFATSDRIRDDLIAQGVEVMDGDPLGWDWKLDI